MRLRALPGTPFARAAPRFANGAAARVLVEKPLELAAAGALVVLHEAGLRPAVDAVPLARVQSQSGRTLAVEGALRVDARAAALANAGLQLALVHVHARFAVEFGETALAIAVVRFARLAGAAPRQTHGAAALGAQRRPLQVVLALAVHDFGPARSASVI